jgi:hypothetical protein
MKPATASADNGAFSVQNSALKIESLNPPVGPEKSPFSTLSLRSFMQKAV